MEKEIKKINEKLETMKKDYEKDKLLLVTGFFCLILILLGTILGNLSYTKELYDKYYVEECYIKNEN